MKTNTLIALVFAAGVPALLCNAQSTAGSNATGNQPPGWPPPHGRPHGPFPLPLLAAMDPDRDGILSADEIAAAPEGLLTLDTNGDGALQREEFLPPPPPHRIGPPPPDAGNKTRWQSARKPIARNAAGAMGPQHPTGGPGTDQGGPAPQAGDRPPGPPPMPPPMRLVGAVDADHDGTISAAEITGAPEALIALDRTGDGQLGPGEYGPPPPPPPAGLDGPEGDADPDGAPSD